MGVLVVCTANVCRSPLAAALLREAWAMDLPFVDVSSAGVRAATGAPVCDVSQEVLGRPEDGAAREISADLVRKADLVLVMEREQRSAVVRLLPGSQNRVFTLLEAEALLEGAVRRGVAVRDLRELGPAMHALRGIVVPRASEVPSRRWWRRPPEPEDPVTIPDGHGRSREDHVAALERVRDAAQHVAAGVLLVRGA